MRTNKGEPHLKAPKGQTGAARDATKSNEFVNAARAVSRTRDDQFNATIL